jgi:GNAT superfamily N-acetyltransferase
VTRVRPAEPRDLPLLAAIEDAGDARFAERFGGVDWPPADSGEDRAAEPGFLLVTGDPVVGFAHVLAVDDAWLLEQVVVHPDHGRRGLGSALLEAVADEVARRGGREVTLRTYADVPWNAPWYARHGYVVVDPPTAHAAVLAAEERYGMRRYGARVSMRLDLTPRGGSRS